MTPGLGVLLRMRRAETANRLRQLLDDSRFKLAVIGGFSILFWWALYRLSMFGMRYLRNMAQNYHVDILGSMFHLWFFALAMMLVFSNAIISYTSLFKSRETAFLLASPLRPETIYLYKLGESVGFSSWAFLFLATPLTTAFGDTYGLGGGFHLWVIAGFVAFLLVPAAAGSLAAILVTVYIPRTRRGVVLAAVSAIVLGGLLLAFQVIRRRGGFVLDLRLATEMFESIRFSENPLLPSAWLAKGMLFLRDGKALEAFFFLGVIASNAAFLTSLAYSLAGRYMRRGWYVSQDLPGRKRWGGARVVDPLVRGLLGFLPKTVRLIVGKDVKTFLRDPVQWSQFLIFFGLLGIYFASLRSFAQGEREMIWKNLIAQMNLLATSLTLATFSTRFVFPQLSLEGRRFWVIGMFPMARREILLGKLALSFLALLGISEALIAVSSGMLQTPLELWILHAVALLGICLGLSGLSVGLGTVYPNFAEENPSKIVAGFGGTLNLVLSLGFVLAVTAIQAVPCFLYYGGGTMGAHEFRQGIVGAMAAIVGLSLVAGLVPVGMGFRAFRRMEF